MGRQSIGVEARYKGHPPETWGNEEDERVYQEIIEGFNKSALNSDHVNVNVGAGVVHLRGIVDDFEDAIKFEEFVGHIKGVKDIKNELQVK